MCERTASRRVACYTLGYTSMGEGTTASSGCGVWEALKCGGKSRRRGVRGKRAKKCEVEPEEEISSGGEVKSEYVWETVGDARRRNGILKKSDVGEESRDEDGVIQGKGDDEKNEDGQKELVEETVEKEKDIKDIKSIDNHGELILKIYVLHILKILYINSQTFMKVVFYKVRTKVYDYTFYHLKRCLRRW